MYTATVAAVKTPISDWHTTSVMPKAKITPSDTVNNLLAALPTGEYKKIEPSLKLVELQTDEVLWEMDEERKHLYFPTTAMISLLYESEDGVSIEVGLTGRQGMVGVVTFIGDSRMAKRAVVQTAGQAYVMKALDVERHFAESPDFQDICMCFTQTLIAQISQNAICNRLHTIEQQMCRYLLVTHDNLQSIRFNMTHARMASVLGVRRESVSVAASKLKDKGLINYSRGDLTLLDRKGILANVCECYGMVREQYDRILSKYISLHEDAPSGNK